MSLRKAEIDIITIAKFRVKKMGRGRENKRRAK